MYLAFPRLLKDSAKVLLLNPTYGEYEFIFQNLLHARIDRFALRREEGYRIDLERLIETLRTNRYDLFVIVNPNNPTGQYLTKDQMERLIGEVPKSTYLWIDETYVEYTPSCGSMERKVAASENVIVCKSMSKVYALSGMRCAYLAANAELIRRLSLYSPPWAVSLPAQIAGVNALQDRGYYEACWRKTEENRQRLMEALSENEGLKIFPGSINAVLCELPQTVDKNRLIRRCMENRLYIRDVSNMGANWNREAVRIAVKDEKTNQKIAEIFHRVYCTK
jgi:histidinol-phosphate/aromatic aminotransferase/cobyric acid decarboxylase-like protein